MIFFFGANLMLLRIPKRSITSKLILVILFDAPHTIGTVVMFNPQMPPIYF